MRLHPTLVASAGLLMLASCDRSPSAIACLAVVLPAIEVEVRDAATGRPAAGGARGAVQDGGYVDSLRVVGWTGPGIHDSTAHRMAAAYERAGTYAVQIQKPGYETWQASGVRVRRVTCGVETRRLQAELVQTAAP